MGDETRAGGLNSICILLSEALGLDISIEREWYEPADHLCGGVGRRGGGRGGRGVANSVNKTDMRLSEEGILVV